MKGICLRSTKRFHDELITFNEEKGEMKVNKVSKGWQICRDLKGFDSSVSFMQCYTDLCRFTWNSIKHLSTCQFFNRQPFLQNRTHSPASKTRKHLISVSITSSASSASRSQVRATSWVTSIATRRPAQLLGPKRHPANTRSRALASHTQNLTNTEGGWLDGEPTKIWQLLRLKVMESRVPCKPRNPRARSRRIPQCDRCLGQCLSMVVMFAISM